MGIDIRRARSVLRRSGAATVSLYWPLGRQRRATALLHRRLAVLEAKNAIGELLFRCQRPLAELRLNAIAEVEMALQDPDRRKLVVGLGMSREVIETELGRLAGAEAGSAIEQALAELVREGVVLQVPGRAFMSGGDVYLAVYRGSRPQYDVSQLSRLVREGTSYGLHLRQRSRREASTTTGRSYRL